MANERWTWDAAAALEALGGAEVALWTWEPDHDRLRLMGATRALGLGPLAPDCSSAEFRALALPQDRALAEDLLRAQPPGSEVAVRIRMRGSGLGIWRGVWLEDGNRAAGVVAPEAGFAATEIDALTGLLDRRSFIIRARERLQASGVHELIVADLNRLRRLNEALGHERADMVLAALGSRLAGLFPPQALLARIGEDEFAALTPVGFSIGAEPLRRTLEQPLRIAGFDIHPTLSVGVEEVMGGEDAPDAAELLRRAELRVETAKAQRRHPVVTHAGRAPDDGLSRLAMEGDLKGALGRGEIVPFYQPVVRLSTGALAGFEALVRWVHPRRGVIAPDEFLPLCEEMGLMPDLGAMMIHDSAVQLAQWRAHHRSAGALTVAVNLSTGEIERPGLVSDVQAIYRKTGLPAGALKLEITEGDIMRDPERAALTLAQLRAAGASLGLDDFGTGFSSLAYLTRLPLDSLKIDRYFVRTLATDAGSEKIVAAIIRLGKDLGLEIVAEGVENAGLAGQLMALGCDYGQGYGYAQALAPEAAEVYLNESYADGSAPVMARGSRG
jgi:c-di-GMP-specific phosphodiesterase